MSSLYSEILIAYSIFAYEALLTALIAMTVNLEVHDLIDIGSSAVRIEIARCGSAFLARRPSSPR